MTEQLYTVLCTMAFRRTLFRMCKETAEKAGKEGGSSKIPKMPEGAGSAITSLLKAGALAGGIGVLGYQSLYNGEPSLHRMHEA